MTMIEEQREENKLWLTQTKLWISGTAEISKMVFLLIVHNTAVIKKLKQINEEQREGLMEDFTLKLLLELYFVGVIEDNNIFINIIKDLTSTENLKERDNTRTNLTLLARFARQGRVFLGLPPSAQETQEEFLKGHSITTDQKKVFRKAFHTYYDGVAELLQSEHASLHQMEHEDVKMFNAKGEPSDDNVSSYEKLLAEALDMQPPVMPEDGHTTRVTSGEDASSSAAGKDTNALEALWDDEDTRAFYECLPDLRAFVPAVLLGEAELKANEHSVKTQDQSNELATESDQVQPTQDMAEVSAESGTLREGKGTEKGKDKEEKYKEKVKDPEKEKGKEKDPEKEKGKEKDAEKKGENENEKLKSLQGANLDALLQRLPGCVSHDLIDQLTVDFCYVNSKLSRKKLVRALFNVPRTSLELLPYYSRMVATLSNCLKDVSSMLLQMLEEEFNFLINKKDQMNIETKIRNIRFIGELCKFRIAPASTVFSCLKRKSLDNDNISFACKLSLSFHSILKLHKSPFSRPSQSSQHSFRLSAHKLIITYKHMLILQMFLLMTFFMLGMKFLLPKIDNNVNSQPGPYIFKMNGQCHHFMVDGESPRFAQLYILTQKMKLIIDFAHLIIMTILRGHVNGSNTRKIILSSSLTVSLLHDEHYKSEDQSEIIARVFQYNLNDMISFIESWKPFGKTVVGIFYAYCFVFLHFFNTTFH
ncbi:YCF protein [Salix suchowensis]|nr:YCF protein [Salix suchowensis]